MAQIDLAAVTSDGAVQNLAGKERGEKARELFHLDTLDEGSEAVEVIIPTELSSISSSYFLGLFSKSVGHLGGREGFLRKYRFRAANAMLQQIQDGVNRATASREPLFPV